MAIINIFGRSSIQADPLCIRSPTRPGWQINTTAYVLPQLAGNLPTCPIPQQFLRDLPELLLPIKSFTRAHR